jgi:large subunit ribosomal protein L24
MSAQKLRKGDTVYVMSGNDKGKTGEIAMVYPEKQRAIVKGIAMTTRHQRPTARNREGGILVREGTIALSNLLLVCKECDKPTRVGFEVLSTGEKVRKCKQCGKTFD